MSAHPTPPEPSGDEAEPVEAAPADDLVEVVDNLVTVRRRPVTMQTAEELDESGFSSEVVALARDLARR